MLQFASPPASSVRPLPKRIDSLPSSKNMLFTVIEDDLRDARRVCSHGQEEDLKYALQKTMGRIEELTSLLKEAYQTQTDLQTEITLAKSNLQLALSNNEMLEDALKRDPSVGWKRWSAREEENRRRISEEKEDRSSLELERGPGQSHSTPTSPQMPSMNPTASAPNGTSDHRFFKFRFGSGSASTSSQNTLKRKPSSPLSPVLHPSSPQPSHLASASLPSLVPAPSAKEFAEMTHKLEELAKQLAELKKEVEEERTKKNSVSEEKNRLEGELESLSQALFEEANKMVASERIKRAETEEELRQTLDEKTALKEALRLLERENGELRSVSGSRPQSPHIDEGVIDGVVNGREPGHARSASAVAVKSRRSSASGLSVKGSMESTVYVGDGHEEPVSPEPEASTPFSSSHPEDAPSHPHTPEVQAPSPENAHTPEAASSSYATYPSLSLYPESADSPWADVPSASPIPNMPAKFPAEAS
ncbi:hypothetical protein NEOLEDRAFT_1138305 [Neolentinus lepideus HHB14362 ss-1]|uniref:GDP/GTP exchange factor Sec2 N-terminal domain-containing protein n=1 Tax=Neolentinus lepideus HHB14362 ss-1 TaxID=1314782 RepID=A0A165QBF6_9AGAM|nr:hypothetical protein NEOLEDRAFT_1138305 [Neolentinus lepideus HHB14362 ss-1]